MQNDILISTDTKLEGYEIESFLGEVYATTFANSSYIDNLSKGYFNSKIIKAAKDEATKENNKLIHNLSEQAIKKDGNGLLALRIDRKYSVENQENQFVVVVTAMCVKLKNNSILIEMDEI